MLKAAGTVAAALTLIAGIPLFASGPLFVTPLHVTRQVHNPIAGTTTVLDEYGYGNRLATVRGARTAIADYEKGELTEIDRDAGTYSVTRFEVIAKVSQPDARSATAAATQRPEIHALGVKATKSGRSAEFFDGDVPSPGLEEHVEVGVDRNVTLSKEALEVLLGCAYPGVRRGEHDIVLSAAASPRAAVSALSAGQASAGTYALPVEENIAYDIDGRHVEFRTTVTRIGNEPPPPDVLSIPPGARLVTSRLASVTRELEELQNPATPAKVH